MQFLVVPFVTELVYDIPSMELEMLVYRIENEDGNGPYRQTNPDSPPCAVTIFSTMENHPLPTEDGIDIQKDDFCGFQSLEHLYTWFQGYTERLKDNNFFITIYKVKKKFVKFGLKQVAFTRNNARLIGYVNK